MMMEYVFFKNETLMKMVEDLNNFIESSLSTKEEKSIAETLIGEIDLEFDRRQAERVLKSSK
jgi:hypothetical protein